MNNDEFEQVVNEQMQKCVEILITKAKEYAGEGDRLHNFKTAAALEGVKPRQALAGMMAKHTVSVYDMCMSGKSYSMEMWNEKITDHMNYLLLLKGLLTEEARPETIIYADGKPCATIPRNPKEEVKSGPIRDIPIK